MIRSVTVYGLTFVNRKHSLCTSKYFSGLPDSMRCQQLTANYLPNLIDLMETAFVPYENVCKGSGLSNNPEALLEFRDLLRNAARDGISVIAVDTTTNKVVGACLNKIQIRDKPIFENFAKSWKRTPSKEFAQFMADLDNTYNLFDHFRVDCMFEPMFGVTLPEYQKKDVQATLVEDSIKIARSLAIGHNVKKSVDGTGLTLEPKPQLISAVCTSPFMKKITKDLGFQIFAEKSFDELEIRGKSLASFVGSGSLTVEYLKL